MRFTAIDTWRPKWILPNDMTGTEGIRTTTGFLSAPVMTSFLSENAAPAGDIRRRGPACL